MDFRLPVYKKKLAAHGFTLEALGYVRITKHRLVPPHLEIGPRGARINRRLTLANAIKAHRQLTNEKENDEH